MLKICSKCGVEKDAEKEFFRNNTKQNGYSSYCKACAKIYAKDYKKKNPSYKNNYDNAWRKTKSGAESISTSMRKHRETQKYKDTVKKYLSKEETKNLIKSNKMKANRVFYYTKDSAKKRNIRFDFTLEEFVKFYTKSNECFYCGSTISDANRTLSLIREYSGCDEIVLSLQKKTGASNFYSKRFSVDRMNSFGEYSEKNCAIACQFCNCAKGFLIPAEQYKSIAVDTIANIVKICEDAGLVI